MKKVLGLMLIGCLSVGTLFAQENRSVLTKEQKSLYKQERFDKNKTKVINKLNEKEIERTKKHGEKKSLIEQRKNLVQEKKNCVNNAQTKEELRLCKKQ